LTSALPATTHRDLLGPAEVRTLDAAAARPGAPDLWLYRYADTESGWRLSIATHAAPGSGRLSLGGFRIAPKSRTALAGYDNDREAIGLAVGMEEKVYWSRVLRVGGPLVRANLDRIVGGKCVLRPTDDARVGRPRDAALLDWAVACLRDCDATGGIHVTTGQDLGHGTMSDGATSSLSYLHARFEGSVLADTSRPTAEGNYQLLRGMLEAAEVPLESARVGLIGAGNIGRHVLARLREHGTQVHALELEERVRASLAAAGVEAWPVERKVAFLAEPFDAVVVNASGGSLDAPAVAALAANPRVRVVCGSENLAMPDPAGERALLAAGKVYAPTELGGMMGYLTAAEESLARRSGVPFDRGTLLTAAERLRVVGREAMGRVVAGGYQETFQEAAGVL
jgi:hypothetical protein